MAAKTANPAEKMIVAKKKLIKRLRNEIEFVKTNAAHETEQIEFRIRQAQTILTALERGTLTV